MEEGARYRIQDAKVTTDDDGVLQLEVRPGVVTVTELSGKQSRLHDASEDSESEHAATDGGDLGEIDSVKGRVESVLKNSCSSGEIVTAASLAGKLDKNPEKVADALETLSNAAEAIQPAEEGYEVF